MNYLLDTNAIINYLNASLPLASMNFLTAVVDNEPMISIVTKIETLGFNFKSLDEQNTMETFINGTATLDLSTDIVNKTIAIRKSKKIKLPDAIIAATALVYDLILISRNTADFDGIKGLKVIDPYSL